LEYCDPQIREHFHCRRFHRVAMNGLSTRRQRPGRGAPSQVSTADTLESRFWTAMVIVAFFFYFLFTPGDESCQRARA
jgi:hypothetical protein